MKRSVRTVCVIALAAPMGLVGCHSGSSTVAPTAADSFGGAAGARAAGSGAADLSECDPADPDLERADAQELFDYDHVPTFDFFLPQDAWEELQANAVEEEYVEARACFEGRLVVTVGLRFKGYYRIPVQLLRRAGRDDLSSAQHEGRIQRVRSPAAVLRAQASELPRLPLRRQPDQGTPVGSYTDLDYLARYGVFAGELRLFREERLHDLPIWTDS